MPTTQNVRTMTPGKKLRNTLVRYFAIGPTTPRLRDGRNLHRSMAEAIIQAAIEPAVWFALGDGDTQESLRVGYPAALGWEKHVKNQRLRTHLWMAVNELSAMCFAKLLGDMVDAGVSNVGEAEEYFNRALGPRYGNKGAQALTEEERAEKAARCLKCTEPATKQVTINHPELGDHVHRMCDACVRASIASIEKTNAYSALWAKVNVHLTAEIVDLPPTD